MGVPHFVQAGMVKPHEKIFFFKMAPRTEAPMVRGDGPTVR